MRNEEESAKQANEANPVPSGLQININSGNVVVPGPILRSNSIFS
jgi:hypothetical protein